MERAHEHTHHADSYRGGYWARLSTEGGKGGAHMTPIILPGQAKAWSPIGVIGGLRLRLKRRALVREKSRDENGATAGRSRLYTPKDPRGSTIVQKKRAPQEWTKLSSNGYFLFAFRQTNARNGQKSP